MRNIVMYVSMVIEFQPLVLRSLQCLQEVKFTTMVISLHDSSILDVSMEVVIDCTVNIDAYCHKTEAWGDYEEEKLSTKDLLRTISHINALGPSAVHHTFDDDE
ncbi:hypothetical protein DPMN_056531 [Dreissena polymorpha]|uniref:Uncharacterized protein n=1 Tax=Dreissena polymorpha TaxID=45954 RepID=A0A9D4HTK7_DREPO|nr:hypothetical protein DPMN_056531 [Dreissena polymorpha]